MKHGRIWGDNDERTYDAGSAEDTDYSYSTTSGKLTQRDFPTVSSNNIRTAYAYDTAGRLQYETYTRETGVGPTNLYRTVYAHSFPSGTYHRQEVRTEQNWNGGASQWDDSWKATYKWDGMERQDDEQREDYSAGWTAQYTTTQEYDKNGNRSDYVRTTLAGQAGNYGRSVDLSYTYDVVNQLTAISDAADTNYNCTVTCDADGNITQAVESYVSLAIPPVIESTLTTDFIYDWANRLTQHKTTRYDSTQDDTQYTERDHAYDATGRLVKSAYKQWWASDPPPLANSLEHTYAGASHIQNYDGTSTYGERWHWAGSQHAHRSPLKNPNADTAAQKGYNLANDKTPQRRAAAHGGEPWRVECGKLTEMAQRGETSGYCEQIKAALTAGATIGEIVGALTAVWGRYQPGV
ncbi:hypothetical protein IIA79_04670 [bacterium]|nr:hypothetical protein [bacterium]